MGEQYVNAGPDYPGLTSEEWSDDPFAWRLGMQRHLLQTAFADRMIGRLLARLQADGVYDRAMIVVTADHGVSFRRGQSRRGPNPLNFSDIASVPLVIKYPDRQGGRVDDSLVRTIDIVPTIAAELGVKVPWSAQGRPIEAGGPRAARWRSARAAPVTSRSFSQFVRRPRSRAEAAAAPVPRR